MQNVKCKMISDKGKMIISVVMAGAIWTAQILIPSKIDAYPYAYVANSGANTVSVIDTSTNEVIATIPVGSSPGGVAITPDGRYAYVTNTGSNTVSVIDTQTNSVIGSSIPVGSGPTGVAVTPDGKYAYVVNNSSQNVSVIDTQTNAVVGDPISIPVNSYPHRIAITPNGRYAYVTNDGLNNVSVIDTTTRQVIYTISVGSHPNGVVISPDGNYVYVANFNTSDVSVVDSITNVVRTSITVDYGLRGIAITPDGKYVYVSHSVGESNNVSVIDTMKNLVIGSPIPVGPTPNGVAITPDGKYTYVANSGSNNVSVIDTQTNLVIKTIPVGSNPNQIAITPTLPTLINIQIINGTDTGILNEADTPGDVILVYTSADEHGTITCNQVATTIEQVYGLSFLSQPADKSGTYNTTVYYTYWIRNRGNGTDTITLTPSNSWTATIIKDDNQDRIHQGTETTTISQLILSPNEFNYFFLAVQIPATATTGQQSTTTLTAKDQNGAGTDDNWGDPDTRTDEVVTICSPGMPAVITITKSRDKSLVKPGGTITYTLTYRNNSGSPATDIVIIDYIPANTTLDQPATGTDTIIEYYVGGSWTSTFSTTATMVKWTRTTPLPAVTEASVNFVVQVK
ncbi:MAG: beta-propeller fold lactonase family protein [bacterium]